MTFAKDGNQVVPYRNSSGEVVGLYKESHALVIGASAYTEGWPDLPGVAKDVEAVKEVLEQRGFHVVIIRDPDAQTLNAAFKNFIDRHGHEKDARLLFYFAGHGHTERLAYGEEMGYIVPVDAPNPNRNKKGFFAKAMDMSQIEVYAKRIQAKHALFLFDSCFSGSIFALSSEPPRNITSKTDLPVRQFITAGGADETVPDESIFSVQFINALQGEGDTDKDGYMTGAELGDFLSARVTNYSKGSQHPQSGKIRNPFLDRGDFVFILNSTIDSPTFLSSSDPQKGNSAKSSTQGETKFQKKIRLAKERQNRVESRFYDLNDMDKIDDSIFSPVDKYKAWKDFIREYSARNPKLSQAKEKMAKLEKKLDSIVEKDFSEARSQSSNTQSLVEKEKIWETFYGKYQPLEDHSKLKIAREELAALNKNLRESLSPQTGLDEKARSAETAKQQAVISALEERRKRREKLQKEKQREDRYGYIKCPRYCEIRNKCEKIADESGFWIFKSKSRFNDCLKNNKVWEFHHKGTDGCMDKIC